MNESWTRESHDDCRLKQRTVAPSRTGAGCEGERENGERENDEERTARSGPRA